MNEPTIGGQTAVELLGDPHHGRANAAMIRARIVDGSLVDHEKLVVLYDAALELARKAAEAGKERQFVALMKVLQTQLKIEAPQKHLNLNVNASANTDRSRLSGIAAKLGVTRVTS